MAGELITGDWQVEYRGLLLGSGTRFHLAGIEGLDGPAYRSADIARSRAHGEVRRGLDFLPGRDITLTIEISDTGDESYQAAQREFDAIMVPLEDAPGEPLVVKFPGREAVRVVCAPRAYSRPNDYRYSIGRMAATVAQFHAHDPLVYSNTEHVDDTTRRQEGSGFSPPVTAPFTLGAAVGGSIGIVNAGNIAAPWTARLDGPLAYPEITHLELGRRLSLALVANGGVNLATGDWIDIDSAARSVRLNGTADRRTQLTVDSEWWDLDPGSNPFQLDADSGDGTLTVTWHDGYLS